MNLEIRASNLAYPMQCAGSLFFELPQQEAGDPAKEGTAAGLYLQALIETGQPPLQPAAPNGVHFDSDMDFYLRPIAQDIHQRAQSEVICEGEILWETRSGIRIRGHYDASYISEGKLYVDDLKYGWGLVEVEENWQVLAYAIGEVLRRQIAFPSIVMRILQPRPHHENGECRSWELTYEQLLEYKERIEVRMDQIARGYKDLQTGPKCKYCPAAVEACPALNKAFYRSIEIAHEFIQDQISDDELSMQFDLVTRATEIIKIKQRSLNDLAVSRIKGGKVLKNYITEPSYGNRSWKPGITPESIKVLTGIDIIEKAMLSPAKAEKLGVPKELVNALVEQRFLGQKLLRKDSGKDANRIFGTEAPKL